MQIPLSVLDLAPVAPGGTVGDSIAASVALAQAAEEHGYRRVWYAEHHNMATIASSATSVLIAHVGAHTREIRLGAGGVMLPNHSPLTVAEQFGTLEAMYPGRIDLGLGRAPGADRSTMYALRRDASASERFPDDVLELQGYLSGRTLVPGVHAVPGRGSHVPLYVLGSSMFGASLAAALGLPFAFASHFAPAMLTEAVAAYRQGFQASEQTDRPHVMAAVNVVAADSAAEAAGHLLDARRMRVQALLGRGRVLGTSEADELLASPGGRQVDQMFSYAAVGTTDVVRDYLVDFARHADADELVVAHQPTTTEGRLRSVALLARAMERTAA